MVQSNLRMIVAGVLIAAATTQIAAAPAPGAASRLVGSWTIEQIPPSGGPRRTGMLVITESGGTLTGVMRLTGSADVPLLEIRENGGIVSFATITPSIPNVTLHYAGAIRGNEIGLSSQDVGNGFYTLTARRAGAAPAAQTAQAAPSAQAAPPPAPRTAAAQGTAPQASPPTAVPPPQAQVPGVAGSAPQGDYISRLLGSVPAPAAAPTAPLMTGPPPQPPSPAADAAPASQPAAARVASAAPPSAPAPAPTPPEELAAGLQGSWIAQQKGESSAQPVEATLTFDGTKGTMRVGMEEWPVFEARQTGSDVSFTLVMPGSPYVTIRYVGTFADSVMQLKSVDDAFTLNARRPDATQAAAAPTVAAAANVPLPQASAQIALPAPAAGPSSEPASPPAGPDAIAQPPEQVAPVVAPPAQIASAAPPPRAEPEQPVSATSSPPSARPAAEAERAAAAPLEKRQLPPLHDVSANNLAKTPLMGWASRQKLGSRTDDASIRAAADGLVASGLAAAGYVYVEVGDGWQGARDAQGVLHPNERFPDMKALGDYLHSKGLKLGLITSAAPMSCDGFEGSYGHEEDDARTFAEWGVDYLVYDSCGAEKIYASQGEMQAAYQIMGDALRMSGRPIVYGIGQGGGSNVGQWAAKTGANLWRTAADLDETWKSVAETGFGQNGKEGAAGPGRWNDPGLLQAGNTGLTLDEARMQFNLWAMLAAPLMVGNDARMMSKETVALLTNKEVIAINQDPLGKQAKRIVQSGDLEVWSKPLSDGSLVLAFFNKGEKSSGIAVSWEQLGLEGPRQARDLWWHESVGRANGNYSVFLSARASMLIKLSK